METVYEVQYNPDFDSTGDSSRLTLQHLNVSRDGKRTALAWRQPPGDNQQSPEDFDPVRAACQRLTDQSGKDNSSSSFERPKPRLEDIARTLAAHAGIDPDQPEGITLRTDQFGNYHIYYGGFNRADGLGHGHAVINRRGKVTYNRPPFTDDSPDFYADDESKETYERSRGNIGGWGKAHHGYDVNDREITFSLGWGNKYGEYLTVPGHVDTSTFHRNKEYAHHLARFRSPHFDLLASQIRRKQ